MRLLWDDWEEASDEVKVVAEKFVLANCYNPQFASIVLQENQENPLVKKWDAVTGIGKPDSA